jgi:hypothetical protein
VVTLLRVFVAVLLGVGCSKPSLPELGTVHGKVTLDGQPVVKALVMFTPDRRKGRTVVGYTNAKGYYSLDYCEGVAGASVGRHSVRIAPTGSGGQIPSRYSKHNSLLAEIKPGDNTFDFHLKSE